jgi:hypothetical protein
VPQPFAARRDTEFGVGYSSFVQVASPRLEEPSSLRQFFAKRGAMEVAVCAITFLTYFRTISFGFVYDDKPVIVDNVLIRSWRFLAHYFIPQISSDSAPAASATFYRPITALWLRINYFVFGLDPAGWHFAMVLCHVLMTYLMFAVVEKLTSNRNTAAIAAILFGLHPVHVENVAWLSSVNDLLLSVFLAGSFLVYLLSREDQRSRLWLSLSVALFGFGLLSKETAAVFPLLIFSYALIFAPLGSGSSKRGWSFLKQGLVSIPYFVLLAVYLIARRVMLHGLVAPLTPINWTTMLLTAPSILWFDVKHLLLPISSSEFYSAQYVTVPDFRTFFLPILLLVGFLIVVGYCISKFRDRRLGIFALVFAVLTVLPTLYLPAIALGNFVHDRFLYLPSVGIVILAALVIEQIFSSKVVRQTGVPLKWGMLAILCAAAFAGTIRHQTQWANNFLLYENALRYAPQNSIVEVNLANEFANLGQYDRALALYLSSLQNDPHSWLSNYSLGYAYYRNGRLSDSENYLKRAIQIDDEDADQFIYLALTQLKRQELVAATENAERALQRAPLSPGFHLVLGKIREARGDRATAIAEYKAEVASHPESAVAVSELKRLQSSQ